MATLPSSTPNQERVAAALASFVFFVPLLMNIKTPFVIKYMKQGFLINIAEVVIAIVGSFLWFLFGIIGLLNFICFVVSAFLAYQAYLGNDHTIAVIYENSEKLIQTLGLNNLFTPSK